MRPCVSVPALSGQRRVSSFEREHKAEEKGASTQDGVWVSDRFERAKNGQGTGKLRNGVIIKNIQMMACVVSFSDN
jgi:hypothetical protein